jgi:hypothetical protein
MYKCDLAGDQLRNCDIGMVEQLLVEGEDLMASGNLPTRTLLFLFE